jgi:hypothetical protein
VSDQPSNPSELAFMLGRIQGDVKHILEALTRNQEQFVAVNNRLATLEKRVVEVEKFNIKAATILGLAGTALMILVNVGLKFIGV